VAASVIVEFAMDSRPSARSTGEGGHGGGEGHGGAHGGAVNLFVTSW